MHQWMYSKWKSSTHPVPKSALFTERRNSSASNVNSGKTSNDGSTISWTRIVRTAKRKRRGWKHEIIVILFILCCKIVKKWKERRKWGGGGRVILGTIIQYLQSVNVIFPFCSNLSCGTVHLQPAPSQIPLFCSSHFSISMLARREQTSNYYFDMKMMMKMKRTDGDYNPAAAFYSVLPNFYWGKTTMTMLTIVVFCMLIFMFLSHLHQLSCSLLFYL